MPGSFVDSNVLIYLASADQAKADRAEHVVAAGATVSVQILTEVANVLRRKMRLDWSETRGFLATLRDLLTIEPVTLATHERGIGVAERYGLSLFDAMVVAAAIEADCDKLWSEDMQNGLVVSGTLTVVDPFADEA